MSKKKEETFESRMLRIREISDSMQQNQLSLEENIALYQEAQILIKACQAYLENAELTIRQVTENGTLKDLTDF